MMEVIDKGFAQLRADDTHPIVISVIRKMPLSADGFVSLCDQHLELIKETTRRFHTAYSITDLSVCNPLPLSVAFDYAQIYMPRQFKAGVQFKAFIKPRNIVTRATLETILRLSDTTRIGLYATMEDALEDIHHKIANTETKKPTKVRAVLSGLVTFLNL